MKRLISFSLAFLLTLQLIPIAFAAEPTRRVSTLSELTVAISEAIDGDTIEILQTIDVTKDVVIGDTQKTITIRSANMTSTFFYFGVGPSAYTAKMVNVVIDGSNSPNGSKVVIESPVKVEFDSVTWKDCRNCVERGEGGALNVSLGSVELVDCIFGNCKAIRGGGIYTSLEVSCKVKNCTFTQNTATLLGGAICATGTSEITDCAFNGNSSESNGGAVGGRDMRIANCKFIGNRAQSAGAITTFSGNTQIQGCTFLNNFAEQNGGAIMVDGLSARLSENTVYNNHADGAGGGLYILADTILENNKVYGNTSNAYGSDIVGVKPLQIYVDNYTSLYQNELAESNYDSLAWFFDGEGHRYSSENPTDMFLPDGENATGNPTPSNPISLIFVMWRSKQGDTTDKDPIKPPNQTKPGSGTTFPPNSNWPNHTPNTTPPTQESGNSLVLSCGKAVISTPDLMDYISTLDTFPLKRNEITRAEIASILYGLLDSESRRDLVGRSKFNYIDLSDSPYKNEVNALTYAGVFSGNSSGNFYPNSPLTFGQLLTILTRFVSGSQLDEETDLTSLAHSTHWAKNAAQIAYVCNWIDDIPIDLEAHVTYGSLESIFERIVGQ